MQSILDHPILTERYFYPRRQPLSDSFMVDAGAARLACHLHAPHESAPTLVHFHGNGEIVADNVGPVAEALASLELNVLLAEYRGYGGSDGEPALGAMLDDVPIIIEALKVQPHRLILFGRSIGSIYAIHGADCFPDIGGLIIDSGVADPLERLLLRAHPAELGTTLTALRDEVERRLNHERILRGFRRPLLVLHTRHDGLVDVDNATRLHAWSAGPKRICIFEDGNHSSIMLTNAEAYFREVERFVHELCFPAGA